MSCEELISCFNNHCLYRNGCFKEELYITHILLFINPTGNIITSTHVTVL